ncbi:MAG: uracil-DNA glycosylase [Fusobacteriota bacterium]
MISNFMKKYNIHETYKPFFEKHHEELKYHIKKIKKERFAPKEENIFRALEYNIDNIKVLILGKDPYFQPGAATGICFEVDGLNSWLKPFKQRSLQNMVRVIYNSYRGDILTFNEIRDQIRNENFNIVPPNKLFTSWHNQGVLLLNSFLTVKIENGKNTSGSHKKYWGNFTENLLEYISKRNKNIDFFLWGNHAKSFLKCIDSKKIHISYHPAMAFGKKEEDFLFFKGFEKTKNKINWLGK